MRGMQFHVGETVEGRANSETWGIGGGASYSTGINGMIGSPRYIPSGDNEIDKRADILVHVRLIAVTIPIITMRRLQ